MLTSDNEGAPVGLIEAQAVISTDSGSVGAGVRDGETGYVVSAEGESAFAERILELLRDPESARQLGEAGSLHLTGRFTLERRVTDLGGLSRELLATEAG